MLPDKYRWTDYQISPTRFRAELIATLLILAVVGVASLGGGDKEDHLLMHFASALSTKRPSNLAAIVKPRTPAAHQANAQSHPSPGKC
jgi:hypothetical protein